MCSSLIGLQSGVGKTRVAHDGIMKNKDIRKIQFGGWTGRKYREIRAKIKKWDKQNLDR